MNKLLVIYASVLLGNAPIVEEQESKFEQVQVQSAHIVQENVQFPKCDDSEAVLEATLMNVYVDQGQHLMQKRNDKQRTQTIYEEDINLGATNEQCDMEALLTDKEIDLGFETEDYLPLNFDAYGSPENIHSISFIESDEVNLGFDTADYLPEEFDPYQIYFNVHNLKISEVEEDLDFNVEDYLPKGFDLSDEVVYNIHSISFIEEEHIVLGFETKKHLPQGFDSYERNLSLSEVSGLDAQKQLSPNPQNEL